MKITVITVCLNSAKTIEKTIESVIDQKDCEFEYIVIDGGSEDGTLAILNRYDAYIDNWISEPDKGIFDAMNKGIEMATGDVIAFLNSDDWYKNDALKLVTDVFQTEDCDCVCFDNYVVQKDGETTYFDASKKSFDDIYIHMIYYHSAIFCKKDFFKKKNNFNLSYRIAADYDWFIRAIEQGARLHYIHKPIFTFCYGGISSVNEIDCAREAHQIALLHLPESKSEYRESIDARLSAIAISASDHSTLHSKMIEVLGKNRMNVLWGAGERGVQCLKWFKKIGISVETVIDSNSLLWNENIEGVDIQAPDVLRKVSGNLIITPDKYTDEIIETIDRIGNDDVRIFELKKLYKELVRLIVNSAII